MQITFRAETKFYDESHRALEREICEFFVVLDSANQPVDHTSVTPASGIGTAAVVLATARYYRSVLPP